jgi:prepilin-type N-terminal cleavage/methylation domain-containing protein
MTRITIRLGGAARDARGFTMIELCVVIVVIGILLATGVAALLRARMASNESAAIAGLRTTSSAQFAYSSGCGQGNYATSYVILGTKPPGNSQGYVSDDLGAAVNPSRNGYNYSMSLGAGGASSSNDCGGNATMTRYYATARPVVNGQTGARAFAVNQAGTVYQAFGATPPDEPFVPPDELAQ